MLARRDVPSGLTSVRFVSGTRPNVGALRAEAAADGLGTGDPFGDGPYERADWGDVQLARTTGAGGGITVAVCDRSRVNAGRRTVERLAVWNAHPDRVPEWDEVVDALAGVERVDFDSLLAEHRAGWARRWADAEVSISGAPADELAARFAVFNLLNAAPDFGEAAVGPRGLTGHGYGGHVFWDADVYVLPALAAISPDSARAMLEYRIRRLPAARAAADALGLDGARFPWESADDGTDVTPRNVRGPTGKVIPIRTGDQEEHIVADVAWAAHEYACWAGDEPFLHGDGRALIVDTARYWASRVRVDGAGRGHLHGLIGPDEYHEGVDDNAFTNVMARWNLRRAAALAEDSGEHRADAVAWRNLADGLVDGWDPEHGLYEQFAGYWDLEPLLADEVARRPFAADLLLGRARVAGSQLIKQADVVLLHHLVPGEVRPGSLLANLAYYEPRTTHGSSLSPAIHAALLARADQPDQALEIFRLAARLDLDDLTGTTADGLHLATMGGVWQALAYGFLGLRPHRDHLDIDPCLPDAWQGLGLGFRFHGAPVHIRADHESVRVSCDEPIAVRVSGGTTERCTPPMSVFELAGRRDGRHERSD